MAAATENPENRERRLEASRLCAKLARLERDPGAKGYAEGMAQRLAERHESVSVEYVDGLRRALTERESVTA